MRLNLRLAYDKINYRIHFLTLMKLLELCWSSENGRQERNAGALVMFAKKLKHDTLEKFCVMSESNGCGNGVGSTGLTGIVGRGALAEAVDDAPPLC